MRITKEQFIKRYCKEYNVPEEFFNYNWSAVECNCDVTDCSGWKVESKVFVQFLKDLKSNDTIPDEIRNDDRDIEEMTIKYMKDKQFGIIRRVGHTHLVCIYLDMFDRYNKLIQVSSNMQKNNNFVLAENDHLKSANGKLKKSCDMFQEVNRDLIKMNERLIEDQKKNNLSTNKNNASINLLRMLSFISRAFKKRR